MKLKYDSEPEFENDFIDVLVTEKGWKDGVLHYKTEEELIQNWADIIYENNRSIDRLGDYPLTTGEMDQIMGEIKKQKTKANFSFSLHFHSGEVEDFELIPRTQLIHHLLNLLAASSQLRAMTEAAAV